MKTLMPCLLLGLMASSVMAQQPTQNVPPNCDPTTLKCSHKEPPVADRKFWLLNGLNVGISVNRTRGLIKCREDHGIGPCTDGGYGEFRAREILAQGLTAFSVLASYEVKKIEDRGHYRHKLWWLFPAINIGLNSGVQIENALKHYGPKERD